MNEELSIGTDIAREPEVALTAPTDAGESVPVDIKHLLVDPENVAQFREQLHCKSQSKETESTSTAESETRRDASESPVLKHSAPNERILFGNNDGHTPPFVSGKSPRSSQNQSTDGSRKDFHEKSMKFDIPSQSSALKASGRTPTNNVTNEEHVLYKSPFFEVPDPSKISLNNTKDFRETFTNTETLPTDTPLRTLSGENKTNFSESVSRYRSNLPQPSPTLKSPATLLRELQNPTVSTGTRTSGTSAATNTSIFAKTSVAVAKDGTFAFGTSARSFDTNDAVSANTSVTKPTETRERPRSSDNPSDTHRTAVVDTIPFLRTPNDNTTPVQESTATQQTQKSQAMLIAQQIRDHIIDRILVSSSALNDNRTVTVQLSPQLLQDTEVQFTQNGTSLDIRLVSQNKDSVQFLQQHQSDLQTYLQGELKTYRAISVRVPSSQASSELSQPQDGRSRNRFDYQSADEEETT